MQKKFFSGLFLILILNLLIKPIYILGVDAEIQNRLGSEVYGNYFALLNFSFLLNILNDLGLSNLFTRQLAKDNSATNPDFFNVLAVRLGLFFVYGIATFVIAGGFNFQREELALLGVLLVNQFFVAGIQFSRATFSGLMRFKTDAVLSIMDRSLLIGICLYLLFGGGELSIWSFVLAQSIAYGLTMVVSFILVFPFSKGERTIKTFKEHSALLKKSIPFATLVLLMMFYTRVDAIMIERLSAKGDFDAGQYAQGYRFLDAINMFALLFAGLMLPLFSNFLSQLTELKKYVKIGARLLVTLGIVVSILGFFHAEEVLNWRYTDSINESSIFSFQLLLLSFLPMCFTYLYGTLLTANGNLKALNIMAGCALIINVILNYILIQSIGFEGAAMATAITQGFAAIVQIVLVSRIIEIKLSSVLWLKFVVLSGVIWILAWLLQNPELEIDFSIKLVIEIALSLIAIAALGLLRLQDFKTILKK